MKARLLALTMLPLIAGCVAPQSPAPAPSPSPSPAPAPTPTPRPDERYQGDWGVADLTPGEWQWERHGHASIAHFRHGGTTIAAFSCEAGIISITRHGLIPQDIAAFITIRTSFERRQIPVRHANQAARTLVTTLPASDPLFDQIIYSRGRFVMETTMQAPLILPTRPEIARVVEDCRG